VLFASHVEAAADVVRIGVGYVPPALKLLLQDARAGRVTRRSHASTRRVDAVWALVEHAWDRVLPSGSADLFYEIWSDRFAQAADLLWA
jgi:hypothetical protein